MHDMVYDLRFEDSGRLCRGVGFAVEAAVQEKDLDDIQMAIFASSQAFVALKSGKLEPAFCDTSANAFILAEDQTLADSDKAISVQIQSGTKCDVSHWFMQDSKRITPAESWRSSKESDLAEAGAVMDDLSQRYLELIYCCDLIPAGRSDTLGIWSSRIAEGVFINEAWTSLMGRGRRREDDTVGDGVKCAAQGTRGSHKLSRAKACTGSWSRKTSHKTTGVPYLLQKRKQRISTLIEVDRDAQEADIARNAKQSRNPAGRAKMLSLMQYTHFDTALAHHKLKIAPMMSGEEDEECELSNNSSVLEIVEAGENRQHRRGTDFLQPHQR